MASELNELQNATVGMTVGVIEVRKDEHNTVLLGNDDWESSLPPRPRRSDLLNYCRKND